MRAVSELTSAVVLMAVTLAALGSVLGYYTKAMGGAWFEMQREALTEEYVSGVKVVGFRKAGFIWLYNYGWNEAEIERVEADGQACGWRGVDPLTGNETATVQPKALIYLSLDRQARNVTVYLKGGVVVSP